MQVTYMVILIKPSVQANFYRGNLRELEVNTKKWAYFLFNFIKASCIKGLSDRITPIVLCYPFSFYAPVVMSFFFKEFHHICTFSALQIIYILFISGPLSSLVKIMFFCVLFQIQSHTHNKNICQFLTRTSGGHIIIWFLQLCSAGDRHHNPHF